MPYILIGGGIVAFGLAIVFWPALGQTRFGQELSHVGDVFTSLLGPFISALIGAAVRRLHLSARPDARPMTPKEWVLEALSVLLCGIAAGGIGAWLGAPEYASWAIAGCAGYIGPVFVALLFADARSRITGNPIPPIDGGKPQEGE